MTELVAALTAVVERLAKLSGEDPNLRDQLRNLAQAFLNSTAPNAIASVGPEYREVEISGGENAELADLSAFDRKDGTARIASPEPLPILTLGSKTASAEAPAKPNWPATWHDNSKPELQLIEARCRLKAEGSRWAANRQRRVTEGANFGEEIEPRDREIIEKAKGLQDCFLWMNNRNSPIPQELSQWDDLAGCYEAVANGVALTRAILAGQPFSPALFAKALDLSAEAQSALRSAVGVINPDRPDTDQVKVFSWLKMKATQEQIFIQHYMRADDSVDPASWPDIAARIEKLDSQLRSSQQHKKQQESRLRRVRYHLKPIQSGTGTDHDWRTIVNTVEEMVKDGLPPSNVELRELLVPIVEDMPDVDDVPVEFQRVLQEIDRFLATRPTQREFKSQQQSAAVAEVANRLAGKTVYLIGGLRRPAAQEALQSAFKLKELLWFDTKEHESVSTFEPYVTQSDLVLLAIRWSSHSYGEVKQFCEKHNKAFVRLPGGYNPNQVAMKILEQIKQKFVN